MACLLACFPDCLHFVPGQQPVAYLIYCFPNSWPHAPSYLNVRNASPSPLARTCYSSRPHFLMTVPKLLYAERILQGQSHQTKVFSVLKLSQVLKLYAECRNQFLMTCCQPLPQSQSHGLRGDVLRVNGVKRARTPRRHCSGLMAVLLSSW